MADAGVLAELEALLDQLFSPSCSNEQRLEINKMLEGFSQQQEVWHYCVYFLRNSSNHHVLMYSLNVLENLVTHAWPSLALAQRAELRHFLTEHLLSRSSSLPLFLCNKIIKVLVFIGRSDWPHHYPEFLSHVLQLIRGPDTTLLGLSFLLAVSEEFGCPRGDVIMTSRKEELATLIGQQVPTCLSLLMQLLNSVAEKQRHSVTPTPPPSPKRPSLPHPSSSTSPFNVPSPPTLAPPGPQRPVVAGNAPFAPLDSRTEEVCVLALQCLAHLFSWIQLSSLITPSILDTIFHFAGLGCDSAVDSTENSGNLGSLAMDCVNELLVKNCVPREFEAFLMKLFEKSFTLLQRLTGETERGITCSFTQLDDRFLAKCSDYFYWFVSSHLKRVEFNPHFPVLEFLGLFHKYTFKQPEVDSFCVCLDTWGVFLDHLIMMTSSDLYGGQSPPTNNHYERYKVVLVTMMENVLKKVQLHHNMDELREIDDDTIDDDNETEWQSFLRKSLEFVGKVAELFPSEAFQLLLPSLETYSQVYLSLGRIVSRQGNASTLVLSEGAECEKLHAVLKDLSSVLQALGRLAEHFTSEHYPARLSEALLLVRKLCLLARFSADVMLFNVTNPIPEILDHDFIVLHAQILGSLQAFVHWLSQFYLDSLRRSRHQDTVISFVTSIVESATPLIARDVPEKIVLAASQLLLSLAVTARPKFLTSLPPVQTLLAQAERGELAALPQRAYIMVSSALTCILVLAWPETLDADQHWDQRLEALQRLLGGVTQVFRQLQQTPKWAEDPQLCVDAKPELKRTLSLLDGLFFSVSHERSQSRAMLFKALSPSIEFAITLFSVFAAHHDILDAVMCFFHTLFYALRAQVGPALTQRTLQTFMAILSREQFSDSLVQEGSNSAHVVEKFLCVLRLLVSESSSTTHPLLSTIIPFIMGQVYPAVSERPVPDVKLALYQLLSELLMNNWRYFFPANVLSSMDGERSADIIEHEQEFFNIIGSFSHSFLQPDLAVFRHNLSALEGLNRKHKLFSKAPFLSCSLHLFLQLLLQALVQKSHDMLLEEICLCVYSMASVDFVVYHSRFLPKFLSSIEGLREDQHRELLKSHKVVEDLPSFVQNLRQFVNDLRCILILNSSVPSGSVKLS